MFKFYFNFRNNKLVINLYTYIKYNGKDKKRGYHERATKPS